MHVKVCDIFGLPALRVRNSRHVHVRLQQCAKFENACIYVEFIYGPRSKYFLCSCCQTQLLSRLNVVQLV